MLATSSVALAQLVDDAAASHTLSTDTLQPPTSPSAVHGPCANGVSASITVSWSATPSTWADGYEILGSLASGGPYTSMGTVSGVGTTSYTASDLSFLTTYHFVVKATKGNWRSAATGQVSRTTLSALCL